MTPKHALAALAALTSALLLMGGLGFAAAPALAQADGPQPGGPQLGGPQLGGSTEEGPGGPLLVPLQCRLGEGPWQECRMRVEQVGAHWFLLIGDHQIEFRHDGSGAVRMQQEGRWRPVTSRWLEDRSLCWDGTCARGDIPLD